MIDQNTSDTEVHDSFDAPDDIQSPSFFNFLQSNNCGKNDLIPGNARLEVFSTERQMKRLAECQDFEHIELKTKHHFSEGVYARELYIPKGVMLTGHIHKYENLNILTKGKLKVLIGSGLQIVEAPFVVVSPPGTKRVALALEDTIWITVHGTYEKDLDKIEQHFICRTEQQYLDFCESLITKEEAKGLA